MSDFYPTTLKAAMTPFPYTVKITDSAASARKMMETHNVNHLAVTREGKLSGVISRHDIDSEIKSAELTKSPEEVLVENACHGEPFIFELNAPLDEVLLAMAQHKLEAVLIKRNERLAGIFTATDACLSFAQLLQQLGSEPDPEIA